MSNLYKYKEFITEGLTPVAFMSTKNELRNKVLNFLWEKGQVTFQELEEFVATIEENATKLPARKVLGRNKGLVKRIINEHGANFYKLTKIGKRYVKSIRVNETK